MSYDCNVSVKTHSEERDKTLLVKYSSWASEADAIVAESKCAKQQPHIHKTSNV